MTDLHDPLPATSPPVEPRLPLVGPEPDVAGAAPARRRWRAFRRNKAAIVSLVFLVLVMVVVPLLAGVIAQRSPTDTNLLGKFQTPSGAHWLGTDDLGRDMFSRLMYATRVSMGVSVGSVAIALVIALPIGALAGYAGRLADTLVMRAMDVVLSIPALMLVFAVAGPRAQPGEHVDRAVDHLRPGLHQARA